MSAVQNSVEQDALLFDEHMEPLKETEDISMLLYKRGKDQEKQLLETVKRERATRELLWKAKHRYDTAIKQVGALLPKRGDLEYKLSLKEEKIRKANERILIMERFMDNCRIYIEKGNIYEAKVIETKEKINEIIVKEHENEQKLVVVYRRKDYLERIISRHHEKHHAARGRYNEKIKQHKEAIAFYEEVRGNIKSSIERAKVAYEKCVELAPKVLESQRKVRLLENSIYGIEMKINNTEDEIKRIRKEKEFKKAELDRLKTEQMLRLEKKMKSFKFK